MIALVFTWLNINNAHVGYGKPVMAPLLIHGIYTRVSQSGHITATVPGMEQLCHFSLRWSCSHHAWATTQNMM